jgi:integrase/recombinase XerD
MQIDKKEVYLQQFKQKLLCEFGEGSTMRNYCSVLKSFLSFCEYKKGEPSQLLMDYLTFCIKSEEPKTTNLHRSAVVKFFSIVKGIDISVKDVPRRREHKKIPKIIDPETINSAIAKTMNIKHRLQLQLFFGCGIRLHEMALLRRKNIFENRNILWLQSTKGNKERIVPIPESARALLYEYISNVNAEELVFGGVCKRTFEKVVYQAFARIGVHATPHMLRHSFATFQIVSGQNPFKVQSWLGHSSIKTTQTYITLSQQYLSESTDLLNGNYMNQVGV